MNEVGIAREGKRAPKRSQTHYGYQVPTPTTIHIDQEPRIEEEVSDRSSNASDDVCSPPPPPPPTGLRGGNEPAQLRRPPLPPPRRSYSVMDCEPEPQIHRLSSRMTLMDLPVDLHYAMFDFLDLIDSTCLGLTNKHLYAIHRRMRGTVALSTRRNGPNELEWAWHFAGALSLVPTPPQAVVAPNTATTSSQQQQQHDGAAALSKLRVRGQAYCRKCGVTRCELHKHIQEWMGDAYEYCSVKQKFGPVASEGAKAFCYMSKPGDPHRCGRHQKHASKVMLK